VWEPVLLGALLKAHDRPDVPMDTMPPSKRRQLDDDLRRRAAWHGLPLVAPPNHPVRTVDALRCLLAVDDGRRGELVHVLFRAAWQQGRSLADRRVLQELVAPFGLDVEAVRTDPAVRDALRRRTADAVADGIFGVPTFWLEGHDERCWGVDRLEAFVARHGGRWTAPSPALGTTPTPASTVELFHDVASPYSYLGVAQIDAVAARHGARVRLTPILLGGLFHAIGTPVVPIATFSARRQAWLGEDMKHAADAAGVPFRFPEGFPLRTVTAQRVLIQEPAATGAMYEAAWGQGRDVGQQQVLADVLTGGGWDAERLLAGASNPTVKAQLRANTERAVALGVCGVPTFRVGSPGGDDGPRFWGQDRLDQVGAALRGWPA
jgi:2-hydroxychromene-2-carboxylate isomerase